MSLQVYAVQIHGAAARGLSHKLPPAVAFACLEFLGTLRTMPRVVGKPLRYPREGEWSARRGEYRVVHAIDDLQLIVHVVDIDHRRDVYQR